jgi:uncharacterized repeat protein (TIGR01451 family)
MADVALTNRATANGTYNSVATEIVSSNVVTQMISDLTITKTADKTIWTTGVLTYTITIYNNASYPYESPVVTDILDTSKVSLVSNSITINGRTETYSYDSQTGLLSIDTPTLTVGNQTVITFQVQKL